jgi:glycerol-3-phosphate O-acyltransferase / dihydroxyacetone phosphate acyltransferase
VIFYSFLKLFVGLILRIYYPNTKVLGGKHFKIDGPVIVISNHPNTLVDPLISAVRLRGSLYFLANAGLYINRIATFIFDTFYCIKIERIQDTNGRPVKNEASFKACDLHLGKGGNIFIAAEGTSVKGKKLLPFKTGAIRIALSASQGKEIKILPVGLNYRNPGKFGSALLVHVGDPIYLSQLLDQGESEDMGTVKKMTKKLEQKVRERIIHCDDAEIEGLLDSYLERSDIRNLDEWYHLGKSKALELNSLKVSDPMAFQLLLEDEKYRRPRVLNFWGKIGFGIGFPLFLWGLFHHLIAAGVPYFLSKYFNKYEEYDATFQILSGLVILPLFYAIQYNLVEWSLGGYAAFIYLITLPLFGYFAVYYYRLFQKFEIDA